MADFVNNAFWYTVWDAKTGDLLASGMAAMCARRLGYASANSFAASVCHWLKDGRQHVKHYIFPRTPAVLFFRTAGQPVNRVVRGQPLCGTIFCYGWRGGDIKPLSGALLAELLDRLKDTEVRV